MPPLSLSDAQYANELSDSLNESVQGSATVVAPGANGIVASIPSGNLPAGLYEIVMSTGYGVVNDVSDNIRLFVGGVGNITPPTAGTAGAARSNTRIVKRLSGAQNLDLRAIAAAAATCTYYCCIIATKIAE